MVDFAAGAEHAAAPHPHAYAQLLQHEVPLQRRPTWRPACKGQELQLAFSLPPPLYVAQTPQAIIKVRMPCRWREDESSVCNRSTALAMHRTHWWWCGPPVLSCSCRLLGFA